MPIYLPLPIHLYPCPTYNTPIIIIIIIIELIISLFFRSIHTTSHPPSEHSDRSDRRRNAILAPRGDRSAVELLHQQRVRPVAVARPELDANATRCKYPQISDLPAGLQRRLGTADHRTRTDRLHADRRTAGASEALRRPQEAVGAQLLGQRRTRRSAGRARQPLPLLAVVADATRQHAVRVDRERTEELVDRAAESKWPDTSSALPENGEQRQGADRVPRRNTRASRQLAAVVESAELERQNWLPAEHDLSNSKRAELGARQQRTATTAARSDSNGTSGLPILLGS